MKNLLLYFLPFLTLSKNVFAGKEPPYALILEALEECKGTNLRDYMILDHLKIFPNHTSSGYMEILKTIPTTATVKFQVYTQKNGIWTSSPLSIENIDFCRFIEKDVWFVPFARSILNLPERCPLRKGYLRFKSMIIYKKTKGLIPDGCFKAKFIMIDKEKQINCIDVVAKFTEYAKRHENNCFG